MIIGEVEVEEKAFFMKKSLEIIVIAIKEKRIPLSITNA